MLDHSVSFWIILYHYNYVKQYSDLKSFSRWIDRAKKHSYMGINIFSLDSKEKADVAFVNLVEKIDGFCKLHMDILIVNFEYNNNQRILVTNIHPEAKTPTHLAAIINNDFSRLYKEGYRTLIIPVTTLDKSSSTITVKREGPVCNIGKPEVIIRTDMDSSKILIG